MRWRVVRVEGLSMLPTLGPGDRLLVREGPVREGDLVVARRDGLLLVKRAVFRRDRGWWLESDNQRAPGRRDSWDFGAVPEQDVLGRVVLRYWPPSRLPQRSEQ
ncbi:S24 family peptidase [Actinocorallia aurantiaca]|uniref:Peptidase S24/S26A/S26B/S26C domain-containing protein n=1 Tax=Actinocorallia aurantiaca TaxID=46204 RepID=A0ABN3U2D5_9ACTN